jgi:TolA-binding protein
MIAQVEDDPDELARRERLNKAIEDANELIKSDDPIIKGRGLLLRGQAKSQLGERTEGLKEYAEGLNLISTKTKITPKEVAALVVQIESHPAFQRPDAAAPNPLLAERHFGEGLHYYWAKKYPEAEAQFRQAIRYYQRDARFEYYLGLAQYHQSSKEKRDAAKYSFEQGAIKEAKAAQTNPDAVRDVNASLERIQGELRQYLNSFRYKAQSGEPEEMK